MTRLPWVDAYDTLGVSLDCSEEDIKKAYKKQSLRFHPDKQGGDQTSFTQLKDAYDILSNAERRKAYDKLGFDIGPERIDDKLWTLATSFLLGPYCSFLFKVCIAGVISYVCSFYYLYLLAILVDGGFIGFCIQKCGGITAIREGKFLVQAGSMDAVSEEQQQKLMFQAMGLYAGLFLLYLGLQLVSVVLTDTFFLYAIVLDVFGSVMPKVTSAFVALFFGVLVFAWLIQNYWFSFYVVCFCLMLFLVAGVLLAILLVHLWLSDIEQGVEQRVKQHRTDMRELKSRAEYYEFDEKYNKEAVLIPAPPSQKDNYAFLQRWYVGSCVSLSFAKGQL
ncbi:unnamed protein product [Amoebophrya sp. A120]|nr:unnamed protein product [Amoebophrya sp. A120]|eukprot:GSA120T00006094001.1